MNGKVSSVVRLVEVSRLLMIFSGESRQPGNEEVAAPPVELVGAVAAVVEEGLPVGRVGAVAAVDCLFCRTCDVIKTSPPSKG